LIIGGEVMKRSIFYIVGLMLAILCGCQNKNNKFAYEVDKKYIEYSSLVEDNSGSYDALSTEMTDNEINEMKRLGFSPQELSDTYTSLKECNEEEFIIELANKNFDKVFLKIPKEKTTKEFIAEYILRLSMEDESDNLEELLNSMIKPVENPSSYPVYQGIYTLSSKRAREYINILYSETTELLQKNSDVLLYGDVGDENNYNYLVRRSNNLLGLATLFGGIKYLIDDVYKDLPDKSYIQFTQLYISKLYYDTHLNESYYHLNYEKQMVGANNIGVVLSPKKESYSEVITTDIFRRRGNIDLEIFLENYKKEKNSNENILNVAAFKFADLMKNMANGVVDYLYSYKKEDRIMSEINQSILTQNYYCGGTFSVDNYRCVVVAGLFDPDTIKRIRMVNESGFKELLRVECGIENPTFEFEDVGNEEHQEIIKKLWNGGCNILEEPAKNFDRIIF
jgi:hypothetical protein